LFGYAGKDTIYGGDGNKSGPEIAAAIKLAVLTNTAKLALSGFLVI
jgi:hypothetical protein